MVSSVEGQRRENIIRRERIHHALIKSFIRQMGFACYGSAGISGMPVFI